jgi:HAD superfamily hydrolase (TIGR01509 family)
MQRWVIFDLDGTLIESEHIWGDVRRAFVVGHGGSWHDGAQASMIGMRTTEWAQYIHDELGVRLSPDEIARTVIDAMVQHMRREVPVLSGADEALARLSAAFPLGLATAASRAVADAVLAKTGWDALFRVVVSADEVSRGKPAPDVYLRALELAHANAQSSVAIEDSSNGIRAGHAAGMQVVAIPNREFPPDASALALAARVLSDLGQLDRDVIDEVMRQAT